MQASVDGPICFFIRVSGLPLYVVLVIWFKPVDKKVATVLPPLLITPLC
jgi:hypothetical protein